MANDNDTDDSFMKCLKNEGHIFGAIGGLLILIIIVLLIILCFLVHLLRKSNRARRALENIQQQQEENHDKEVNSTELSEANPASPQDNPMYYMESAIDAMYDTVMDSTRYPMPQSKTLEAKGKADGREIKENYDYISHEAFQRKPSVPEVTCTAPQPDYSKIEGAQSLPYEPGASESASPSEKKPREYLYSVPMKKRSLSTSADQLDPESKDEEYSRLQHAGPKSRSSTQIRHSVPTFTEDENGGALRRSFYNVDMPSSSPDNTQPAKGEPLYSQVKPPPLPPPITDPEFQSPQPGNGATVEESYNAAPSPSAFQDWKDDGFLMGTEEALYDDAESVQRQGVTTQPPYAEATAATFQGPQKLYDEIK